MTSINNQTAPHPDMPRPIVLRDSTWKMPPLSILLLLLVATLNSVQSKQFVTCDLDLGENAIAQLPSECQGLDNPSHEALLREADSFERFHGKLLEYEKSFNADTEDAIYQDWEFRAELYGKAELHSCANSTEILQEFVDCMVDKREQMILQIEQKMAGIGDN